MPDAGGGGSGADGGVDADPVDPVDPVPPGPFPIDPRGGEFAWVISAPGAGDLVNVAIDRQGNIFVAATQTGAVTLGSVHVAQPASGKKGLLVLKLAPDGRPLWGRSVASALAIYARAIAVTPAGDAVIGGALRTGISDTTEDGFVIVLDGDDGTTRWSAPLASGSQDHVVGIAVGPDAAGGAAIYAYGKLGQGAVIGGHALPYGTYLLRYDDDGTLRWAQHFPRLDPGYRGSLALDPQRGPVIAGTFYGELMLGDQVLTSEFTYSGYKDAVVAGFHPDGELRFARQIFSEHASAWHDLAVAPSGDVYFASDTSGTETIVDGHTIPIPDLTNHLYLLRLTPEGRYASSTVINGRRPASIHEVATDDTGAAYLLGSCDGQVDVQPEITCASQGSLIASYGADDEYRWATHVGPAWAQAIAPVPGKQAPSGGVFPSNRMIVAGQALSGMTSFGGVSVPTQQLFIAALAAGPARPPSPLPAAPAISSVKIDGISDRELRQGSTGTLVIQGAGLDQVTRARLGDLDVHVPAGAGTLGELRLPVMIPHGHAPGWLALTLGNAGGSVQIADAVRVTPWVVSSTGSTSGRGTFTSPLRLCGPNWLLLLRYGDELLLRNGVHTCNQDVTFRRGVIIRGESKAGTIVRGTGSSYASAFGGFGGVLGRIGAAAIENLTIEGARDAAIRVWTGRASVTDVDVRGGSAWGIHVDGGIAAVTRFRYEQGTSTAILIERGSVDASQVDVSGAGRGVFMREGTLRLADSSISSNGKAVEVGSLNDTYGTREVTIARTTLRSKGYALDVVGARLTVTGSTIELLAGAIEPIAIYQQASALTLTDSVVRGGDSSTCVHAGPSYAWDPGPGELWNAVNLTLDRVELTCGFGVYYYADSDGSRFRLRRSRVKTTRPAAAVSLGGDFTAADLGTAASPGDNWIEAAPGHHALRDGRPQAGPPVDAHGTTLNGLTFTGDVLGPVDVSGAYRIAGPNTIRF